ncbi:hypothetical protein M9H77_23735 [Catharanthus roseus]|uniref:Uncharacterized protein n=1 Tax=Catharanthus roseus TaxID=4058 RepID=A0ACC0AWN0_CATRO|nr:hypothetical protein M9H77_23735 [Catharanthus roseus]
MDTIIVMENSLQERKMELVTSLLMLKIMSIIFMIPMGNPFVDVKERIINMIVMSIVLINGMKVHDSLGIVDCSYDRKAYDESLYCKNFYRKGYQSEQDMHGMKEHRGYVQNQFKMSLPPFFEKCEPEPYLEWDGKAEELSQVYELMGKDKISLALEYFTHAAIASFVLGIEDQGKSFEKDLSIIPGDITIIFSLNIFSLCHEVSLGELGMLLVSYTSHVSIFGEFCAISLDENLFPLVPCMLKCLTPCVSLENQLVPNVFRCLSSHDSFVNLLLPREAKLHFLCFEHKNLHGDSFMEPKVVEIWLFCAIFDVLHARIEGKFVENNDCLLTFLILS